MRLREPERVSDRLGFTIVELAIALTIASILIGLAVPRMQTTFTQRDVNGARDGVLLLSARARARAMEQGRTVEFHLRADEGLARVVQAGETIEELDFADSGVQARSESGDIIMCYAARGYATLPCSTEASGPTEVNFFRGTITAALEVWPLGQLRKL